MVSDFKNGRALVQQHRVVALDAMNALVGRRLLGSSPFAIEEHRDIATVRDCL